MLFNNEYRILFICFAKYIIPKVFIEAKPFKEPLDKHIDQIIRYGYSNNKVPFILLTNFKQFKLFDVTLKPDKRNPNKGLKTDLLLTQYDEQFDKLWVLSRDSVLTGKLDELLLERPAKSKSTLIKSILDDLKEWREKLAKDIYKNNPALFHSEDSERDANYLKEITQRILDRIIFMRFCEGRELMVGQSLKEIFEERRDSDDANAMLFLEVKFKRYNETFDSDLFSPQTWESDLIVNFKVLKEIILDTYEPYQFEVIPLEILGNMYEQYLGYTISKLTEHQVKYDLKPELKKNKGVFYTPEYIVDYIVQNTIGKLLQELSPNKIEKLRILDPACGSGSFLIKAYDEMLIYYSKRKKERMEQKEKELNNKLGLQHSNAEPRLTIEEKRDILKRHIYGVDIDEQAVEVTKLSLMLKMLEGEQGTILGRAILPMLDGNIKCGNSIVSGDTIELKKYFSDDFYKAKPFLWNEIYKTIMKDEGGFDVVIGNPPYVRYENLDERLKEFAKSYYESAKGFFDIFQLFLERSFSLLRTKGKMGFIFPNLFLKGINYKYSREYFYNKSNIEIIRNYGDGVFEGVKMPTCITILKKDKSKGNSVSYFIRNGAGEFINYDVKQKDFGNDNFIYGMTDICDSIQKNNVKLDELVCITRGLEIGRDKAAKTKVNSVEFLFGEDISRYAIKNISFLDNKTYDIYKKNDIIFKSEKIVIRETGSTITATYDNTGLITNRSLYCISSDKINLKYLLAIINSKVIQYYYESQFRSDTITFPKIRIAQVREIPIKLINFSNPSEKKHHDDLVALVDIMLDLNKRIQSAKGAEQEQIQRQINKTDIEIDDLVYKLYDISDAEKKIIEESLQ